jgi:hypothetical protein
VPLHQVPLGRAPFRRVPLHRVPLHQVPLHQVPLGQVPLHRVLQSWWVSVPRSVLGGCIPPTSPSTATVRTAWNSRSYDPQFPPWIEARSDRPVHVDHLVVHTGYQDENSKYGNLFQQNARPRDLRLIVDGNHVGGKQDGARHAADRLVELVARWAK